MPPKVTGPPDSIVEFLSEDKSLSKQSLESGPTCHIRRQRTRPINTTTYIPLLRPWVALSDMSTLPPSKGSPPAQKTTEVRRPRPSRGLTVSFDDEDESESAGHVSRLQYEVAECVETKTVTTTTTTKRSFPPLFIRQPRALESLDSKEYPLANGPTPPDLRKFSLDLNETDDELLWSFPGYDSSFSQLGRKVCSGLDAQANAVRSGTNINH